MSISFIISKTFETKSMIVSRIVSFCYITMNMSDIWKYYVHQTMKNIFCPCTGTYVKRHYKNEINHCRDEYFLSYLKRLNMIYRYRELWYNIHEWCLKGLRISKWNKFRPCTCTLVKIQDWLPRPSWLRRSEFIRQMNLNAILNTERSYKSWGHAPLKHFVGFPVQWWKARITVAREIAFVFEIAFAFAFVFVKPTESFT